MHSLTAVGLVFVGCVVLVCGRPNQAYDNAEGESHTSASATSQSTSSSNFCEVNFSQIEVNGNCSSKLTIEADGIHKDIEFNCEDSPPTVININHSCLIGDRCFIENPGELVLVTGDTCTKEVFHEQDGKLVSKVTPMSKKECDEVKEKIVMMKNQQKEYIEWFEKHQNGMHQGLAQLHNQVEALMANIGNPFGFI